MTTIKVAAVDEDDDAEIRSLRDWLRSDPEIRTRADISVVAAEPGPGEMGASLEGILLVLDPGFQIASLAVAIAAWRSAVRPRSSLTVERDGVTVTVSPGEAHDVQAILDALGALDGREDGDEGDR